MKTSLKFLAANALISGILAAAPASAAPIEVTLSGDFFGILDGNVFGPTSAVFTGLGDTDDAVFGDDFAYLSFSSFSAAADRTYVFSDPISLYYMNGVAGFARGTSFEDAANLIAFSPSLLSKATTEAVNATSGIPVQYLAGSTGLFATNYGDVSLTFASNLTFNAFESVAAVPEPATWAMLIGGFGVLGGAMRRRSTVRVAFAA